ncbi:MULTISPECIES: hypothetical protein [unclassified Acidithiobacillus]|uniref:hypothetical protein n=1 Tax=unclassified Acidithiobacillus TaxID=2614800 RepID=UPI0018795B98|nr:MULTISPECIES: hypothetical protein [unclassified Acidithiobacillus]MBE7570824.1 hypothetical protein [Acidithiobacillus sp. HP-2]
MMKNLSKISFLLLFTGIGLSGCVFGPSHQDVRRALKKADIIRAIKGNNMDMNMTKSQRQHIDQEVKETKINQCRQLHGLIYRCSMIRNGQIQIIEIGKLGGRHWQVINNNHLLN